MRTTETDEGESGELRETSVTDVKRRKCVTVEGFQQCQMQVRNQTVK